MNTQQSAATQKRSIRAKKSMISAILNDAVDSSALTYWAGAKDIVRSENGDVVSFIVFDDGPDGEPLTTETKKINEKSILAARMKLISEDVDTHREVAAQFVGPQERWDYDSDGLDALIQVALFGKKVYG